MSVPPAPGVDDDSEVNLSGDRLAYAPASPTPLIPASNKLAFAYDLNPYKKDEDGDGIPNLFEKSPWGVENVPDHVQEMLETGTRTSPGPSTPRTGSAALPRRRACSRPGSKGPPSSPPLLARSSWTRARPPAASAWTTTSWARSAYAPRARDRGLRKRVLVSDLEERGQQSCIVCHEGTKDLAIFISESAQAQVVHKRHNQSHKSAQN